MQGRLRSSAACGTVTKLGDTAWTETKTETTACERQRERIDEVTGDRMRFCFVDSAGPGLSADTLTATT